MEELLWTNFAPDQRLHDYSYVGEDFRERERIRRGRRTQVERLRREPPIMRAAMLSDIADTFNHGLGVRATGEVSTDDTLEMRATLSSPDGDLVETVLVRITDPERTPPKPRPEPEPPLGIPELVLCSREGGEGRKSWGRSRRAGVDMSYDVVVQPFVDEDKLLRIYVNLDSSVLKEFNGGAKSAETAELAERRYVSAVYFHTLFLFATTKSRKYGLRRGT